MTTPRQTCAPNAVAHPINAAVVSLEPSLGSVDAEWLTADGNAVMLTAPESARAAASKMAAKYERLAAGLRAFAGEPGVCAKFTNLWPWPWPCMGNASTIWDDGPAARAWRARQRHLRNDVCAPAPRLVQP